MKTYLEKRTIIYISILILILSYLLPQIIAVVTVEPPTTPRDFTSSGVYYHNSGGNAYFAVVAEMDFEQIVLDADYVQFNDSIYNITSTNRINISLDFINANILTASYGNKVMSFYANTTSGNAFFNISGFYNGITYAINKGGVSYSSSSANISGFIIFNNSDWTEAYFEIYQDDSNISPEFISIENTGNGTQVYTTTPTFNWTRTNSTSQYHLQISNVSNIWTAATLVFNCSDICEVNYPAYYTQNTTRVSFTLPTAIPAVGVYYCRVRGQTK